MSWASPVAARRGAAAGFEHRLLALFGHLLEAGEEAAGVGAAWAAGAGGGGSLVELFDVGTDPAALEDAGGGVDDEVEGQAAGGVVHEGREHHDHHPLHDDLLLLLLGR